VPLQISVGGCKVCVIHELREQEMKCPRDGAPLTTEPYGDNTTVDRCATCAGVWLDLGELDTIQQDSDIPPAALDDVDVIADAYEMARQKALPEIECPRCEQPLEAAEYAYCSRILFDRCGKCGGIWLDAAELEALEKFFKHETRPREIFWATLREASRIWGLGRLSDLID
jgi:Zn-finger nucleic acid-binding protein